MAQATQEEGLVTAGDRHSHQQVGCLRGGPIRPSQGSTLFCQVETEEWQFRWDTLACHTQVRGFALLGPRATSGHAWLCMQGLRGGPRLLPAGGRAVPLSKLSSDAALWEEASPAPRSRGPGLARAAGGS